MALFWKRHNSKVQRFNNLKTIQGKHRILGEDCDIVEIIEDDQNTNSEVRYPQDPQDLAHGILTIHAAITGRLWEDVIRPIQRMEIDDNIEKITIYLSTNGGDISSAMTLCDVLDKITKPTDLILFDEVWSAGTLIACAGFSNPVVKKACYSSTVGVIHKPFLAGCSEYYDIDDLDELHEHIRHVQHRMKEYYLSHSKMTVVEYRRLMKNGDHYLDAEELLRLGIVDKIL